MTKQKTYIEKIAILMNLTKTDVEIIVTLQKRNNLLISEIAREIKRTQRHVHQRIQFLYKKGILVKEIEILKNKRIAYRYSLIPFSELTARVREDILAEIEDIEKMIGNIKSGRV